MASAYKVHPADQTQRTVALAPGFSPLSRSFLGVSDTQRLLLPRPTSIVSPRLSMRICTSTLTFCPRSCTLPPAATPIFQPRPFRLAVCSAGITFSKVPFHIPHPLCRSLSSPVQSTSNVISAEFCPCFPQNPLSILPGIPDPAACQTQLRILSRSQHLAPGPYSAFCAGTGNRLSIPSLDGALSPPPVFAQHPVSRNGDPAQYPISEWRR